MAGTLGGGFMWFFWILILAVLVWLVISATRDRGNAPEADRSALEILRERYARGEIDRDEFEQKKRICRNELLAREIGGGRHGPAAFDAVEIHLTNQRKIQMSKSKYLGAVILAALLAAPVWAAENAPADSSAEMPMMQQGGGMMPGAMMPMMQHGGGMMPGAMMPMMQQGGGMMPGAMMPMMQQGGGMMPGAMMPMMQQGGGMMMPGAMMPMMPMMHPMGRGAGHGQHGGHHGMHSMGGMGHMMMHPQMMQTRMQHMHNMEQHLKNIESLLQQLVDQGKSG